MFLKIITDGALMSVVDSQHLPPFLFLSIIFMVKQK